jgi:Fe-S-cluster containining protein
VPDDDDRAELTAQLRRIAVEASEARSHTAELAQTIESLIDILVHAKTLKPGHVAMLKRVAKNAEAVRTPPIELSTVADKYAEHGDDFECAPRLHLCQARCCSFAVKLSRQDLEEGQVRWEIDHPYRLPREAADGYCTYLARTGEALGGCTNYEVRPATCRSYTCRDDARVWLDFEAMVPAPMPDHVVPIAALTARRKA